MLFIKGYNFILLALILAWGNIPAALPSKGWQGIIPLHSTREDVRRLLGTSTLSTVPTYDLYDLKDESVFINYSTGKCADGTTVWDIPPYTVINVNIAPKQMLQASMLITNPSKYRREVDSHLPDITYYINEEEGITIQTARDDVTKIYYGPTKSDRYLRCDKTDQSTPNNSSIISHNKFDEYGDISSAEEKKRLEQFVIRLRDMPDMIGYIIAYAGRQTCAGEAKTRAERAKKYLLKKRSIDAKRIITIDGGYREQLTVELFLVPTGVRPPLPMSTINPKEVQIIQSGSTKNSPCSTH